MSQNCPPKFKRKIVRLYKKKNAFTKASQQNMVYPKFIFTWCKQFRDKCQPSPKLKTKYDNMKEILNLKKENEQLRKKGSF